MTRFWKSEASVRSVGRMTAALLVLALGLAACSAPGSSDDGSASGGDDTADPVADGGEATEGEGEILIASAMPLTGPYASDGEEMNQALEMAIDEYNEDGGVLGRELRLLTCDVAALEVSAIQGCAERLLGENPHAVITGYDDSGVNTLAFGEGDMPYLHAVTMLAAIQPVIDDPEKYGNVFQYDPSDRDYGTDAAQRLPEIAQDIGFEEESKTIAVISTDYAYNVEGAEAFKENMQEQGYEVVVDEVTPFGVEEWSPILTKIEQEKPAYISFWNLDPADAARFISQLRQRFQDTGLNSLVYMQYTPSIPEFLELAGDDAEGVLWSTVIGVSDNVGRPLGEYAERFAERFGDEPQSIHGYVVRDAVDMWAQAATEAGCVECFDDVIQNLRDIEFEGFAGNFKFAPLEEGQYAMQGDDLLPTIWSQVQGGENVRVLPDVVADGDIQLPPWLPQS